MTVSPAAGTEGEPVLQPRKASHRKAFLIVRRHQDPGKTVVAKALTENGLHILDSRIPSSKSKPIHKGEAFSGLNCVSLRITPAPVMLRKMIEDSHIQDVAHWVELNLRDVNQLFNTIDPSPFREKDLDRDAEEFIVSWTREFPLRSPVLLVIYFIAR
jgi:hypothetical protein